MKSKSQRGFTVTELLVSLTLFGIVGGGISSFMIDTLRRTSLENRISKATQEAQNAIQLLTSEIRLSNQISPYLPGTDVSLTTCSSAFTVNSTSISFLVAHDATSGSNGLARYLVGYRYDSNLKQIIRGTLASSSATTCSVPSGDPTDASNGMVVASNIVQVDADGNGSLDPIFSKSGDLVTVTLGARVTINSSLSTTQNLSSEILLRSN
jgi:prepilin-type N-terminal cleavage/methylation domain-containing protein